LVLSVADDGRAYAVAVTIPVAVTISVPVAIPIAIPVMIVVPKSPIIVIIEAAHPPIAVVENPSADAPDLLDCAELVLRHLDPGGAGQAHRVGADHPRAEHRRGGQCRKQELVHFERPSVL